MALRALILVFWASGGLAQTSSPEIEMPGLPDVAITIRDPASPTGRSILIEPTLCAAAGSACAFLILHEHGHAALAHDPRVPSLRKEREADAYAAARAPSASVLAAWDLIRRGARTPRYGSVVDRARALCQAATQAENWIGPPC